MGNRKARWFKLFGGILVSAFLLAILIAAVLYLRLSTVIQSLPTNDEDFSAPTPPSVSVTERAYKEEAALPMGGTPMPGPAMAAAGPAMGEPPMPPTSPTVVKVALTRKLIRDAWLTLLVQDVPKVAQQVRQVAEEFNGYVAESSQTRRPDGS
jgi:cellulose synthase/poly-beta-1,6-N-acetylglucosamine synthase-like glycosyltransferase